MIVTFPTGVGVSSAIATPDPLAPHATGKVSSFSVNGSQVTINLTNVSNAQTLLLTLFGVSDGENSNDVNIPLGVLLGDGNKDRAVNSADVDFVTGKIGQALNSTNFRADVTINGAINKADV